MIGRAATLALAYALVVCVAAGAPMRAPRGAKGDAAARPASWVLGAGAGRSLPKGSWRVAEGTANVTLEADGRSVRGLRVGVATLRTEDGGGEIRITVARGALEAPDGTLAARAFFVGRTRDGAFAPDDPAHRATLRTPSAARVDGRARLVSYDAAGAFLAEIALPDASPCADASGERCASSPRLRLVPEAVEAADAMPGEVALEARLGGRVAFAIGADEVGSVPVCVPGIEPCGFEVALRPLLVRAWRGGPTVFKGAPEGEEAAFHERIVRTMRPWESCGIRALVGPVRVVDPPRDRLLSFGLPFGLPSDGREELEVRVGRRVHVVSVPPKLEPRAAAEFVRAALEGLHVSAALVARPWLPHEERPAAELLVPAGSGREVRIAVRSRGRLALKVTRVELRDGLDHFDDARSSTGSQEERALLLPLVDSVDATVEVVAVPFFGDGRRVGESFVAVDDPALVNVMIVDRAGLAASRTSHVLAHELGHVLLRSGDHPDEGSRDAPRLLMDSDASDASRFGPRLLTVDECARARKQGASEPHRVLAPFRELPRRGSSDLPLVPVSP